MRLSEAMVSLAGQKQKHKGKRMMSRMGFVDENKQVFLPPSSVKRASAWRVKMEQLGYTF
jgi:hypothetical protein